MTKEEIERLKAEAQKALSKAWDDRKWREERSLPEGCEPLESGAGCPFASGWKQEPICLQEIWLRQDDEFNWHTTYKIKT